MLWCGSSIFNLLLPFLQGFDVAVFTGSSTEKLTASRSELKKR